MTATTTAARREFERTALPLLDNLHGMAMRLTRDQAEAEDLVQDTMVRAYRFWDTFKNGTNIKAWLFTILRNTFINGYHRNGRRQRFESDVTADMRSCGDGAAIGWSYSTPPRPDDVVAQQTTHEALYAALDEIRPDYKTAIILADLEGLGYQEIATLLEIPIGTVMSRLYRGRRELHRLLFGVAEDNGWVDGGDEPGVRITKYTRSVAAEVR